MRTLAIIAVLASFSLLFFAAFQQYGVIAGFAIAAVLILGLEAQREE